MAAPAAATNATRALAATGVQGTARQTPPDQVRRAAEEFESVFISQILGQMGASFGVPSLGGSSAGGGGGGLGGGGDENPFASMLRDEYAKVIGRSGGIGVANAVMHELLRAQEVG